MFQERFSYCRVSSSFVQALDDVVTTHLCLQSSFSFFVSCVSLSDSILQFPSILEQFLREGGAFIREGGLIQN